MLLNFWDPQLRSNVLYVSPQFATGSLEIENLASLPLRLLLGRSKKQEVPPGALSGDHSG